MKAFQSLSLSVLLCVRAANADIIDDIVDAVTGAVTCAGCKALFVPLKGLAALGDSAFTGTLNAACLALTGSIDLDVCRGAVRTQGPIIAEDLRRINPLGTTSTKLCNALLGACAAPSVIPYTVPFPKPKPANPKQWVSTGKAPFQVLHFSDVHIDRNYTVGADATCSKPICCRNYADQTSAVQTPAGRFGMRNCDTPTDFALELYKQIGPSNKFSIFTGDVIEASVWLAERNTIVHDLQRFTQEISTLPAVSVYPTLGNQYVLPSPPVRERESSECERFGRWCLRREDTS
ncbi:hypothetical protein BKA70DRAFT_1427175 [Coprinopsis sp. MPI-PUGE-AT-0042]|nr:hypothetical protein BKA70DRAFT_1427175 [Coprinopsis sp. MPI-PUGE-AT-0042]